VSDETPAAACRGYTNNEHVVGRQCKIQRPLHLAAQLVSLLLQASTLALPPLLGFLQGSLKFGINRLARKIPLVIAFGHDNSLPRTHAVNACACAAIEAHEGATIVR
jgi:hypothetical protein